MIFNWIENDSLRREEQLMNVLYDCGMATFEQLKIITGWKERNLREHISTLQKRNKRDAIDQDEQPWIQVHYAARLLHGSKKAAIYTLGKSGMLHVHQIREDDRKIRETPLGQMVHFFKTNEILVRALKAFDRKFIRWYSSYEATDLLIIAWNQKAKGQKLDRRNAIRPDGRLVIQDQSYYIEFDNGTEGPRQLERKFHGYVEMMEVIQDTTPIIWVTNDSKRMNYLIRNWEALKKISYADRSVPQMHFFVEGDETKLFTELHGKTVPPSLRRAE